jgi:hypothetical protein
MKNSLFILIICLLAASCGKDSSPAQQGFAVSVRFVNHWGNDSFQLNSNYINSTGENFVADKLLYYASNWSLGKAGAMLASPDTYFLIDQANAGSRTISINTNAGELGQIAFLLGVDSLRNVSGAQGGALDPLNGMFWTWNTGYIMAKFEGNSPVSTQPNNKFQFHIGGFSGANNVLQTIVLPLPRTVPLSSSVRTEVVVKADISKWFNGSSNLSIAATPLSMEAGPLAKRISQNYAAMFSILAVNQQ